MKRNVATAQASMEEVVLPERVQEALGQLVGAAKEGLLAMSVAAGIGVMASVRGRDRRGVGPKGKHDASAARCVTARGVARSPSAAARSRWPGRGPAPSTAMRCR